MTTAAYAPDERLVLPRHAGGAMRAALYLALAVPLGLLHLVALLPFLALDSAGLWRLADLERKLANRLLYAHIPPLPYRRMEIVAGPPRSVLVLLLLRLPVAVAAGVVSLVPLALTFELVRYGFYGISGTSDQYLGPLVLGPVVGILLWLLALPAGVLSIAVLDALQRPLCFGVVRLLAPAAAAGVAVREALAERIGDQTLAIAYWLPERSAFVDEHGRPVELPEPGSGRAWTEVAHEGRRVAAIQHAAEFDARPELVRAAAAGAVLALANERLKAELRARIEDVRASRARIVEAGFEARRRIERDLHDGAQQQLVSLSLDLGLLKTRVASVPDAAELVDASLAKLTTALAELRELARGIHPAILAERGLPAAVGALVERTPLPVELHVATEERFAPALEAAAYFVVAEALTNVVKYAEATQAQVTVRRDGAWLEVEIADDGVGGADPADGSGLRGLDDRAAAVDGTLAVMSPRGRGTRVLARLPVRAA